MNRSKLSYFGPVAVAGLLLVIAVVLALFSGPVPAWLQAQVTTYILPLSDRLLRVFGIVALGSTGLVYLWQRQADANQSGPDRTDTTPPELPRNAPQLVGESFTNETTEALLTLQLSDADFDETTPHERLRDVVHRSVILARECSDEEAERAIETGEWTDDPVASAFFSDPLEYPLRYQLFKWARPTAAYEEALDRASQAVDQYVHSTLAGTKPPAQLDTETRTAWLTPDTSDDDDTVNDDAFTRRNQDSKTDSDELSVESGTESPMEADD